MELDFLNLKDKLQILWIMFQILLPAVPIVHQLITTNLMISNFQDKNTGSDRTKSNNNSINKCNKETKHIK